jgi:hypothetical protein
LPTTARPLAVYQDDCYAGRPAATLRQVDQGRAIYVGVLAGAARGKGAEETSSSRLDEISQAANEGDEEDKWR